MTLIIFGDSLLDGGKEGGNLTAILESQGLPSPFPDPPYSNGKASNGLVLSETIAKKLEINPDTLISRFTVSTAPDVQEENVIYAVAGATSEDLLSQVDLFLDDLVASSKMDLEEDDNDQDFALPFARAQEGDRPAFLTGIANRVKERLDDDNNDSLFPRIQAGDTPTFLTGIANRVKERFNDDNNDEIVLDDKESSIDVILGAGSNDVFEYLELDLENLEDVEFDSLLKGLSLLKVLFTKDDDDDQALALHIATSIVDNTNSAYERIEDVVQRTVMTGLPPLQDIPFAFEADQVIDSLLPGDQAGDTRDFLTVITEEVNDQLMAKFEGQEDVLVLDTFDIFEEGLEDWQSSVEEMGLTPIIESDFISSGSGNIEQFAFIDQVHPTASFNEFLALEASEQIASEFANFGMA